MTDYLAIAAIVGYRRSIPSHLYPTDRAGLKSMNATPQRRLGFTVSYAAGYVADIERYDLQTYIGKRAGQRVFDGDMRRGQYTRMDAVGLVLRCSGFLTLV